MWTLTRLEVDAFFVRRPVNPDGAIGKTVLGNEFRSELQAPTRRYGRHIAAIADLYGMLNGVLKKINVLHKLCA